MNKVENVVLYFSREAGAVTGRVHASSASSEALMYLILDIRLIYLTWGYLLYQEIKVHTCYYL